MSEADGPHQSEPPRAILIALRAMLRPLVAFLIRHQIHHGYLSNLLKSLYIEVAERDFQLDEKRVTLSRLSLLTGIHRREAKRIREQDAIEGGPPFSITLGAQIIARWMGDSPWQGRDGQPRALPRETRGSDGISFDELVRSVSVDLHPRSILDEWIRLGLVECDEDDLVRLRSVGFVPTRGFDEKAHFIGRNVRDHMSAAFANLDSDTPPFLERSTYYGSLPADAVPELANLAREAGQDALVRVNDRAREIKNTAEEGGERRRINFGVYFYEDAAASSDSEATTEAEDDD